MKSAIFALGCLVCRAADAVHAQVPAAPGAVAPASERSCLLVTQNLGQYVETPLPGFDPAVTSQPLPAVTAPGAVMIVCIRTTIIPEVTDYRVLTELRLPLSIRAGPKTLFLGAAGGKLQIGVPEGEATAEETKALRARLDEMNAAIAQSSANKRPQATKK